MPSKNLFVATLLAVSVSACTASDGLPAQVPEMPTLSVAATFYPLAFLAKHIGGSFVTVMQITPGGVEPHDYEQSPQDIAAIYDADVFVMNGGVVDAWGEKMIQELQAEGVASVVMMDRMPMIASNPHVWLDPVLVLRQIDMIRDAFVQNDPAHAEDYTKNADALQESVKALDASFHAGLQECALREVIVSHDAFYYLSARYNFTVLSIAGISPDEEPSAKRLAELADIAQQKGITHIFFEELVSPSLANTLAAEVGANTLILNPLEGLSREDSAAGDDYISIMERNLANLRIAMRCL